MTNKYIKPETKTIKVESQHIMAGSLEKGTDEITNNNQVLGRGFNFDFFEEEEETPGKSDDEDWEDWEDEDDP